MHHIPLTKCPEKFKSCQESFLLERYDKDVRKFIESCPICQTERSDHTLTRGQLHNMNLRIEEWQEINIDFVTDLPDFGDEINSIKNVIDKATRVTHLIHCSK